MRHILPPLALIATLLSLPSLGHQLERVIGIGSRSKALAGAGVSLANDYSASFYNPAGLSYCGTRQVSLGYDFGYTDMLAERQPSNSDKSQSQKINFGHLGICLPLPAKTYFGFYASVVTFDAPISFNAQAVNDTPFFPMYGAALSFPASYLALSNNWFEKFSLGVGITLTANSEIAVNINSFGEEQTNVKGNIRPSFAFLGGLTVGPFYGLKGSFVVRAPVVGETIVDNNIGIAKETISTKISGLFIYSPADFVFGLSYQPLDNLTVGVDVTYQMWSSFTSPFLIIEPQLFGVKNETYQLRDIFSVRTGIEYLPISDLAIRLGYGYRPTPFDFDPKKIANIFDSDTHMITAGVGYVYYFRNQVGLSLDSNFGIHLLEERRNTRDNESFDISGKAITLGLALGLKY